MSLTVIDLDGEALADDEALTDAARHLGTSTQEDTVNPPRRREHESSCRLPHRIRTLSQISQLQ